MCLCLLLLRLDVLHLCIFSLLSSPFLSAFTHLTAGFCAAVVPVDEVFSFVPLASVLALNWLVSKR